MYTYLDINLINTSQLNSSCVPYVASFSGFVHFLLPP